MFEARESTGGGYATTIAFLAVALIFSPAPMLCSAELSGYRGFQFGMNIPVAARAAGTKLADIRVIHQRPALIQELEWQPRVPVQAASAKADPVKDGVLCFFNGELSRIVVTYDRSKVEGMSVDDMVEGISAAYGQPVRPGGEIALHSIFGETAPVLARWQNTETSYDLVRTGDRSGFAMIVYSKRLDALAQSAIVEAVRLEAQEAPRREIEQQKKRDDEARLLLDKARLVNKPNFRP